MKDIRLDKFVLNFIHLSYLESERTYQSRPLYYSIHNGTYPKRNAPEVVLIYCVENES